MEKGTYSGRRVDFSRYATTCFTPTLFGRPEYALAGCGASALALLTGIPPANFITKNKHYSDGFMLRSLRQRGFHTVRLTQCNVSKHSKGISDLHVILVSQLFRQNEATWVVVFNRSCYHNFSVYSLEALSFLNKPILSAYVLSHQKWQRDSGAVVETFPQPKASKGGVNWAAICNSVLGAPSPEK